MFGIKEARVKTLNPKSYPFFCLNVRRRPLVTRLAPGGVSQTECVTIYAQEFSEKGVFSEIKLRSEQI